MIPGLKDPNKVKAGKAGARRRWGPPRVVRLDSLPPDQARAIRAYLAVAKHEEAANDVETLAADGGGTRDADSAA